MISGQIDTSLNFRANLLFWPKIVNDCTFTLLINHYFFYTENEPTYVTLFSTTFTSN